MRRISDCVTKEWELIVFIRPECEKPIPVVAKYTSKITAIRAWRYFKHSPDVKHLRLYFGDQDEAARLRVQLRKTDGLPSEENLLWMATVGKKLGL